MARQNGWQVEWGGKGKEVEGGIVKVVARSCGRVLAVAAARWVGALSLSIFVG